MDNVYILQFNDCRATVNQVEPIKMSIIICNVVCHYINDNQITITFTDAITCQMARDILGDEDWQFKSEKIIYGTYVDELGYKIQRHYFNSLSVLTKLSEVKQ